MLLKVGNIIFDGRFGGPQNRIVQVAEGLRKYGIETIVIMPKRDSRPFYSRLVEKEIQAKRLYLHGLTQHKPHLYAWMFFFVPELFSLYKWLKGQNIKLVHCNSCWQIKDVLASSMAGKRTILHLNDTWMTLGIRLVFRILNPLCDGFIVTGKRVKESYFRGKRNVGNIAEIQAPVDTAYFNPKCAAKDGIIGNNQGVKIVTIANINPTKGLEYFVEMASFLNRKYRNLHFYIVGACFDSQKKYLTKLNRLIDEFNLKNVFFYGKSNDVPSVLKAADIFVCSSLHESGPMSVWEAMAMEKAIVSTDVGDVSVYIKNGQNGFVIPPRNAEALAEKASILIDDENLRVRFGKLARATAKKELDVAICADRHRRFYLEVMRNKGLSA